MLYKKLFSSRLTDKSSVRSVDIIFDSIFFPFHLMKFYDDDEKISREKEARGRFFKNLILELFSNISSFSFARNIIFQLI